MLALTGMRSPPTHEAIRPAHTLVRGARRDDPVLRRPHRRARRLGCHIRSRPAVHLPVVLQRPADQPEIRRDPRHRRQADTAGVDAPSLVTTGKALVALHNWTFLFGPGVLPGVNALCLGYLLYRSRLVPRIIPLAGLIGAPLIFLAATATMFGVNTQTSVLTMVATVPIFFWEGSLGVWLAVKGFKPSKGLSA